VYVTIFELDSKSQFLKLVLNNLNYYNANMIRSLKKFRISKQVKPSQHELLGTKTPSKVTETHLQGFVCLFDPWGLHLILYHVVSSDSFFPSDCFTQSPTS